MSKTPSVYYTEPRKEKSVYIVNQMNGLTGKQELRHEFGSKILAHEFVNTINIYINGKVCYSGL